MICPRATVKGDGAFAVGAGVAAGAAGATGASATEDTGGAVGAAAGSDVAFAGAFGPSFTPATRGHATPTMNPIDAIIATLVHAGLSSSGVGTRTVSGGTLFDDGFAIPLTTYHARKKQANP